MELLKKLFFDWSGEMPETINPIRQAGSNRQYYRLINGEKSAIGVINNDIRENRAFINFTNHFNKKGVNVPEIYAVDKAEMCYLQSDLGDNNLFDKLIKHHKTNGVCGDEVIDLYKQSIRQLAYMQIIASQDLDYNYAYPSKVFGKRSMKYDLNYFKYYFVKIVTEICKDGQVKSKDDIIKTAKLKITSHTDIFKDTLIIYNQALGFYISVCEKEYKSLEQFHTSEQKLKYIESITHLTRKNQNIHYDFDKGFYKFPSYFRRAAIMEALGICDSHFSRLENWHSTAVSY